MNLVTGLAAAFSCVATAAYVGETVEREEVYRFARAAADASGKPLLVIGGPLGTNPLRRALNLPAHQWGDVTLDLDPGALEGAPAGVRTVVGDVRKMRLFRDKEFGACMASHVLEHLPTLDDLERAVREMWRVADTVCIAGPAKTSPHAWLVRDHHLWVTQLSDGTVVGEARSHWDRLARAGSSRTFD